MIVCPLCAHDPRTAQPPPRMALDVSEITTAGAVPCPQGHGLHDRNRVSLSLTCTAGHRIGFRSTSRSCPCGWRLEDPEKMVEALAAAGLDAFGEPLSAGAT